MPHSSRVPFFGTRLKSCVRIPFGCIHLKLWSTIVYARVLLYHVEYVALVFPPPSLSPLLPYVDAVSAEVTYHGVASAETIPQPVNVRARSSFPLSLPSVHPFYESTHDKVEGEGKKGYAQKRNRFRFFATVFPFFFFVTSTINIRNSCRIIFWNWNDERRSRCSGLERKKERKRQLMGHGFIPRLFPSLNVSVIGCIRLEGYTRCAVCRGW